MPHRNDTRRTAPSLVELLRRAEHGDAHALTTLGRRVLTGQGVAAAPRAAIRLPSGHQAFREYCGSACRLTSSPRAAPKCARACEAMAILRLARTAGRGRGT